ncbi:GTPase IMAP family member 7-like [Ylistrum balloti]|uniref:GTPase IMAP family member 7-like n=1 Tax=Ylistrum balloti TaxID=509963 RepID=UPI002905E3F7|nr:GTPase IMAP family member 7-like [Ylistrum balloti]
MIELFQNETLLSMEPEYFNTSADCPATRQHDGDKWECDECGYYSSTDALICEGCFSNRHQQIDNQMATLNQTGVENETRLILIGKTGTGKSATGNMILGKKAFQSAVSCRSVTRVCRRGTSLRFGRMLSVVDTPGLFDTGLDNHEITKEILKCVGMSAPGPHAILLVISIDRFTKEECDAVRMLQQAFGEEMNKYLIVIFTRKDELDRCLKTKHDLVSEAPPDLTAILKSCDFRFLAFNNFAIERESEQQVQGLFDMVNEIVSANKGECYTSCIFSETERIIKDREKEIKKQFKDSARIALKKCENRLAQECEPRIDSNRKQQELYRKELKELHELRDSSNKFLENATERKHVRNHKPVIDRPARSNSPNSKDDLYERMLDCEKRLRNLQTQEGHIISSMKMTFLAREQEIKKKLEKLKLEVRNTVREEIEKEDRSVLRRIWTQVTSFGKGLVDGFKRIFESKAT